jgi:DNA ligase (NAD+)
VYREGSHYFCTAGLTCPPQVKGRIAHYASRDALDISGLGSETAGDMVQKKMVGDIADLYRLSVADIRKLAGFAQKSARQLHQAIQKAKRVRLDRFLYALGIRHVGRHAARIVAEKYRSLESLKRADTRELQKTSEVGPEIARSIDKFFRLKANRRVLKKLSESDLEILDMPSGKKSRPLEGVTFVFTGKLKNHTRQEVKKRVEDLGGRAASSVSGNTDILVAGEESGSKYDQGREMNIKIFDEKKFERYLRTHS